MITFTMDKYSRVRRLRYKYKKNNDVFHNEILNSIIWFSFPCVYTNILNDCIFLNHVYDLLVKKRYRYKKYVRDMLATYGQLYLVTFTFNDDYINLKKNTLYQYVSRWCKVHTLDYFGCADYGKRNGRLHYHCICAFDSPPRYFYDFFSTDLIKCDNFGNGNVKFFLPSFEYGFTNVKLIKKDCDIHKSLNYAFKSAFYSFKSLGIEKPFHKRKVTHYSPLFNDSQLFNGCCDVVMW